MISRNAVFRVPTNRSFPTNIPTPIRRSFHVKSLFSNLGSSTNRYKLEIITSSMLGRTRSSTRIENVFVLRDEFGFNGDLIPWTRRFCTTVDEEWYHEISGVTLDYLMEKFEELDSLDITDFDVIFADGVVTVKLGSYGTFVINKQAPNKQLWLSSPISGPSRFHFDKDKKQWINVRTSTPLFPLLNEEISKLLDTSLDLDQGEMEDEINDRMPE